MKILLAVLLVLLFLLLLPLAVAVQYKQGGLFASLLLGPVRLRLYPPKEKKKKKEPEKAPPPPPSEEAERPQEAEKKPPKGGALDLVRAALPLVKPALAGLKRRLTIRQLELQVVWAAADPADAALGYGCANAALGALWAVIDENFRVKKSRLGCSVDFQAAQPTVYLDAVISTNLWQLLTLGLPLLVRFLRNTARLKRAKGEKTKKEA